MFGFGCCCESDSAPLADGFFGLTPHWELLASHIRRASGGWVGAGWAGGLLEIIANPGDFTSAADPPQQWELRMFSFTRVGETLPGSRVPLIFLRAQRFCGPSGSPSRVRGTQRRRAARGDGPTFPQHPVRGAGQHPHGRSRRGVLRRAGVAGRPGPPLENPRRGPFWAEPALRGGRGQIGHMGEGRPAAAPCGPGLQMPPQLPPTGAASAPADRYSDSAAAANPTRLPGQTGFFA